MKKNGANKAERSGLKVVIETQNFFTILQTIDAFTSISGRLLMKMAMGTQDRQQLRMWLSVLQKKIQIPLYFLYK
jgi:hypothetical protein